jgi:hypothetical protein
MLPKQVIVNLFFRFKDFPALGTHVLPRSGLRVAFAFYYLAQFSTSTNKEREKRLMLICAMISVTHYVLDGLALCQAFR